MRREADVDTHELDNGGAIAGSFGEANSTALLANVYYDFRNSSRVTPYVGLGLGQVMVDFKNFGVPGLDALDDDDDVFGWQLTAGIDVKIGERWSFRTDFRMLEAEELTVTSSAATGNTMSDDAPYMSVDMTAGVRVRF